MRVFATVLCAVVLTSSLLAQTFRGGIVGTITDSTGASIGDAAVKVVSSGTGLSRTVQSDAEGNYRFTELPVGAYDLVVTKTGFNTQTIRGVMVNVSAETRNDVRLAPGTVQEVVEVEAGTPTVDTSGDTVGGTIESRQLESLPVNGRDYMKVMTLVPGATSDPASVSDSPGSFGIVSVNGNRGRSNNYLLDGTDMNDGYRNDPAINEGGVFGVPSTILPLDALEAVPVISGAEAEYGRNAGGIVNIVTKSGSNDLHGSLFEYFRNNALDARNYFNASGPQNSFHNNQFGGSLGGPIWKDHTFFFLSYEGQREVGGISSLGHVPTQSDIDAAIASAGSAANPVITNLLNNHYPWPQANIAPDANGNNLQATTIFSNRLDSFIAKIDHHFHTSDVFTGRYYFGDSDQSFPLALVGGGGLPGYNTTVPTRVQILSLSLTHVFSPKLLVEIRGGYNRFAEEPFAPQDSTFDPASVGLNTRVGLDSSGNPLVTNDLGLPLIIINSGPGVTGGPTLSSFATVGANLSVPRGRIDTNWQYFTNFSYNTGQHNFKFGYEFRRTFVNGFFDSGYRGRLLFPGLLAFIEGQTGGSITTGAGHQTRGDSHRLTFQNNHAFYAQDSWKATRNLTLNFGLRWDYFGVIGEEHNRFSIFDPTSPFGARQVSQLYPKDFNNFAPRASFAYDFFGKGSTVFRAGWGLFYDAFSQDFFVGQLPFNTFNPGPAYNFIPGVSNVQFSGSPAITTAACGTGAGQIPVPGSAGLCANPVFTGFSATDIFTVDQRLRTPYVQNYNINIEQALGPRAALQVGYVGSSGRKLFRYLDLNQANPATEALPYPNFVYINQFQSSASSSFNSLQTTLRLRSLRHLNASLNYTYSHSIDNASDGQDYVPNASQPDNSLRPDLERASSNFDTRHRFSWNYSYDFGTPTRAKWLLGGWGIDGVVVLATGQPVNVNYLFEGDFNGSDEFFGRPDVVGDPFAGRHLPDRFLNANAFAVPCTWDPVAQDCVPGTNHFGNLGRNAFAGPNYRNWDFALSKSQQLTDRLTLKLRADFINILNHPNFSNPLLPNFAVDFLNGGLPDASGRGIGSVPITATPDVGSGNPFLGGGGPRNIQVAVRLEF